MSLSDAEQLTLLPEEKNEVTTPLDLEGVTEHLKYVKLVRK